MEDAPQLRARFRADWRLGVGSAYFAAALLAVFELVVSRIVAQGPVRAHTLWRFVMLDAVLMAILATLAAPVLALVFMAPRAVLALISTERARAWPGFGARIARPIHPATAWIWAIFFTIPAYIGASYGFSWYAQKHFKHPQLTLLLEAAVQLGCFLGLAGLGMLIGLIVRILGRKLEPTLGGWSPFGRILPAVVIMIALLLKPAAMLLRVLPELRDVIHWRIHFSEIVGLVGVSLGARWMVRRGGFWPSDRQRRKIAKWLTAVAVVTLVPATLWFWGGDPEAKTLAIYASPTLSKMVDFVRWANDFDGDGYGSLLGENDCAPFNAKIHPGAIDIPDNGIDENCDGHDFSMKGMPSYRKGAHMAVPDPYKRDWNFLLLTIDATRFDHTGFGGYKERKGRDTTPRLDELAKKSTMFRFANAPAAGTMASVPGIITSKFFHSGIALGPERSPMPPKVLPENTLIAEVMKRGGYHTGAILTHEYFNDWGLDQGFDSYDNSIGATPDPARITSQDVTSKAEAWIAQQGTNKWFLWCHYLDPHGKYMAHPGEVQFGSSEEDLYDGEIAYTDKYIGKLLDFIAHSPSGDHTIVFITADHGDGFMEHGFINHGMALYFELLHVPLIVYIPDGQPHAVDGPVSPLDIMPTMADLAQIDISDLSLAGESLIPQLFYGRDAKDRIVFAETNYPNNDWQRAAVSDDYKLIFHQMSNLYELYDLHADPAEHKNLWNDPGHKADGAKMKAYLDEWMDRSFFARDPHNQAQMKRMERFMLDKDPKPAHPAGGLAAGAIEVLGWDVAGNTFVAGREVAITLYLKSAAPTTNVYKVELELGGEKVLSSRQERFVAGDGIFPTNKWQPGDMVKESFHVRVPTVEAGASVHVGVRVLDEKHQAAPVVPERDATVAGDGTQLIVGELPVSAAPAPPPAPPPPPPGAPQNPAPPRER